jgi:hypothetical protein
MFIRWKRRERTRLERQYVDEAKRNEPDVKSEVIRTGDSYMNRRYECRYYKLVSTPTGEWVKSAVLVESVRTPTGPRLKHVCYLGSIREAEIEQYGPRLKFWTTVEKNLDQTGIVGENRKRIEAVLSAVVLKPSRAERLRGGAGRGG